jgi:3',5'-cyclic AMP phosphodiesterase CpdA
MQSRQVTEEMCAWIEYSQRQCLREDFAEIFLFVLTLNESLFSSILQKIRASTHVPMRVIAHISDLHFGKVKREMETALLDDLRKLKPSLIAISGDITQRARRRQFAHARSFLAALPAPYIVIPGNHDIPVDVARRFFVPLQRYRYYIHRQVNPVFVDDEICIVGINTARSLVIESGKISMRQLKRLERTLAELPPSKTKRLTMVMTHHPFIRPPTTLSVRKTVGNAEEALTMFALCGVDMVLSGHFHCTHCSNVCSVYNTINRPIIQVQAGTAISTRTKHEHNAYNVLRVEPDNVVISSRSWEDDRFAEERIAQYGRRDGKWIASTLA